MFRKLGSRQVVSNLTEFEKAIMFNFRRFIVNIHLETDNDILINAGYNIEKFFLWTNQVKWARKIR